MLGLRQSDVSPLQRNRFVPVTVPLYYEGHVYRAGSRIRITISAPNGDQPIWSFGETSPLGRATVAIAFSKQMPSRLVLPAQQGRGGGVDRQRSRRDGEVGCLGVAVGERVEGEEQAHAGAHEHA